MWEDLKAKGIKPFYEDESVIIIHDDCRNILPLLPDRSIDLVLTDPPYGYNEFGDWTRKEAIKFWRTLAIWVSPRMKEGACFYSFVGWKYYCEARQMISLYTHYLKTLIWDKRTFIGTRGDISTLTYHNISEPIILSYLEGASITFNLEDVRVPTIHNDPRSNPNGKRPGDIISCIAVRNNDNQKVQHKGQKPTDLIELFIKASSNKSDLILDPFLGSGTTAYCAKKLGRKCIGVEIEERYCQIAAKRCSQTALSLPVAKPEKKEPIKLL